MRQISLIALLLALSSFVAAATQAQSFPSIDLYGCWRHDAPERLGQNRGAYKQLCFRRNGTVYQISFLAEGRGDFSGRDDLYDWRLAGENVLVIGGENCLLLSNSSDAQLFLARCDFAGLWARKCKRMTDDGTGCAE
jgi:hypothetical protein